MPHTGGQRQVGYTSAATPLPLAAQRPSAHWSCDHSLAALAAPPGSRCYLVGFCRARRAFCSAALRAASSQAKATPPADSPSRKSSSCCRLLRASCHRPPHVADPIIEVGVLRPPAPARATARAQVLGMSPTVGASACVSEKLASLKHKENRGQSKSPARRKSCVSKFISKTSGLVIAQNAGQHATKFVGKIPGVL